MIEVRDPEAWRDVLIRRAARAAEHGHLTPARTLREAEMARDSAASADAYLIDVAARLLAHDAPPRLHVYTARLTYGGPDRFDVTRKSGGAEGEPFSPSWPLLMGSKRGSIGWDEYRRRYRREMRSSWQLQAAAWQTLLAKIRIVLVCYCTDAVRCHRRLLARLLVEAGAVDCGELPAEEQRRVAKR